MAEKGHWITKNGRRIFIRDGGGKGGVVAAAAAVVIAAGGAGGAGVLGGAAGEGGVASEALAGNAAGDVADALPGRSLKTRRAEARKSAERGKADEAWRKLRFKELKRTARRWEQEGKCVAAATDRVREFLVKTPCASLNGMLLAVGDGHGNAAVISIVRVGFRSKKQAKDFEKVERVQGSGDVRPLDVAATLGIAGVRMTGLHYQPRADGAGMVVAEADTAAGRVDPGVLDALAYAAAYLPVV
ncbi:hypothetical protein [Amycolatopsis rifamycinica]|uniref:Uncharacterized protein n=1 Tax=Amycolatopsis rifamycinica TaxID=287986 RepID=A0A066UCZ2_9PSEU|nr:hypothetical protein [Amycolatopsis rifamycinica]KDN23717.1 hypothetical protein DV20_03070 [Amycolatopsis rifamycinica]